MTPNDPQLPALRAASCLYRRYLAAVPGAPPHPTPFIAWAREAFDFDDAPARAALALEAGATEGGVALLGTLLDMPPDANPLFALWQMVRVGLDRVSRHELDSVQVVLLLRYADGTVMPVTQYCPDLMSPELGWNDATVSQTVAQSIAHLAGQVEAHGLDGLYERSELKALTPEARNVFSNFVAQLSQIPQLDDRYRAQVRLLSKLVLALLYPEKAMPPDVVQMVAEARRARADLAAARDLAAGEVTPELSAQADRAVAYLSREAPDDRARALDLLAVNNPALHRLVRERWPREA